MKLYRYRIDAGTWRWLDAASDEEALAFVLNEQDLDDTLQSRKRITIREYPKDRVRDLELQPNDDDEVGGWRPADWPHHEVNPCH